MQADGQLKVAKHGLLWTALVVFLISTIGLTMSILSYFQIEKSNLIYETGEKVVAVNRLLFK